MPVVRLFFNWRRLNDIDVKLQLDDLDAVIFRTATDVECLTYLNMPHAILECAKFKARHRSTRAVVFAATLHETIIARPTAHHMVIYRFTYQKAAALAVLPIERRQHV